MLEIIALIYLGSKISKIIKGKGLKPFKYVLLLIVLWILFEFLGIIVATIFLGEGLITYPFGIAGAALGAYLSLTIAKKSKSIVIEEKV